MSYFGPSSFVFRSELLHESDVVMGRAASRRNDVQHSILGGPPYHAIVIVTDTKGYVRVLSYYHSTTITRWGPPKSYRSLKQGLNL